MGHISTLLWMAVPAKEPKPCLCIASSVSGRNLATCLAAEPACSIRLKEHLRTLFQCWLQVTALGSDHWVMTC